MGTNGRFEPDASIDLHGRRPDAALELLRREIDSGRYRGRSLAVIHGQGRGILRDQVREYARSSPLVLRYWPGEDYFLPGGGGVTVFFM